MRGDWDRRAAIDADFFVAATCFFPQFLRSAAASLSADWAFFTASLPRSTAALARFSFGPPTSMICCCSEFALSSASPAFFVASTNASSLLEW